VLTVANPIKPVIGEHPVKNTMRLLTTWGLVLLWAGIVMSVDLSSIKFPAGLDLRKIQNLMRLVDPKTCGCARPEQHCEVPVPEARFVGFTCKVGTFCCRMKKRPGNPNLKELQSLIPKKIQSHLQNLPQQLLSQTPQQPQKTQQPLARFPPSPQGPGQQFTQTRLPSQQQQQPFLRGPTQTKLSNFGQRVPNQQIDSSNNRRKPQNQPIYNPNEVKTPKKKAVMDEIEPHHLGLPKGIKAFIKPVSQLQHRILVSPAEEPTQEKKDNKICRCQPVDDCPPDNRDYITFRKSCPFGQVQCCQQLNDIANDVDVKINYIPPKEEIEILSTTSKAYPVEIEKETQSPSPISSLSHIRPVNIPVYLVPKTTGPPESASSSSIHSDTQLVDQTFRKKEVFEGTTLKNELPKITSEENILKTTTTATTTTPNSVSLLYSAMPYTIVSSSVSIRKIEWENIPAILTNDKKDELFQVHGTPIKNKPSNIPNTPIKHQELPTTQSIYTTRNPIFIPPYRQQINPSNLVPPPVTLVQQRRPVIPAQQPIRPYQVQQTKYRQPIPQQQVPQQPIPQQPIPQNRLARPNSVPQTQQYLPTNVRPGTFNAVPQVPQQTIYRRPIANQNQVRPRPPIRPQTTFLQPTNVRRPLQPRQPTRQIISRADTILQPVQPRQMGFVESIGDAAIQLVTGLFSWPL